MSMDEITGGKTFHKDVLDIILEAAKKVTVQVIDGKPQLIAEDDYESIYWSSRSVNSARFSRFVLKLKELETLGDQAVNHMMPERSEVIRQTIKGIVSDYKYSIDAKSSESVLDNKNKQSTLIDKLSNYKIEKKYTTDEKMKSSFLNSIIGKDKEDDES